MQQFMVYNLVFLRSMSLIFYISLLLFLWNLFVFYLFRKAKKKRILKGELYINEGFLMICSLYCGGIGAWLGCRIFEYKAKKANFKVVVAIAFIITSVPIVHIVHGLTLDRIVVYREMDFYATAWPEVLDGYRIGFMADFHAITEEDMQEVVDELNRRELDLLLLGGDFSVNYNYYFHLLDGGDFSNDHYRVVLEIISGVNAVDGIWGVDGNHDIAYRLFAAKEDNGIGVLDNSGLYIHPDFFLAGVQDLWNRQPNIAEATIDANETSFILLVSHNPDITMIQSTSHLDLIFAGHTHGGHITLFGWPFILYAGDITNYGTRFGGGWAESADGIPVYTSVGIIGDYYMWPRIFSRPEVIILTMYSE